VVAVEQAKEGCVLNSEVADSILAGLDELFTASGQGLVAFEDAGTVVFSTRFANEVLGIHEAGSSSRVTAQILAVKDSRPLTFSELPSNEPALVLVKNASGERLMQVFRVRNQRVFMLRDAEGPADQSLIDILAHDLRGGMVPAKTYAQMLLTSVFGALNDKQLDAARVIDASLQKQEDRIANVLDMVKASENRLEVSLETVSLIDVVRQSASIEREARRRNVNLMLELDESAALIQADAKRLQRVLTNLLLRSLKHSAQGQSLGIELRYPSQSACRLRVWDVGSGSAEADMQILQSKSAERVQNKPVDRHAANFEIAAVYDIVLAHGGELKVQTEAGTGTTYRLNLPVQRRASAQASASGKPRAILIAGADAAERLLLEGAAKKKDLEAVFAENGKEAIKHSRARHFPLVILNERFADCDLAAVVGAIRFQRPEDPQVLCIIRHDGQAVNDSSVQNWRGGAEADAASAEMVLSEMLQKF
jgi:signal transduction histidine kinase